MDPIWEPSQERIESAQLTHFARHCVRRFRLELNTYPEFYRWSVENPAEFWSEVWDWCGVIASKKGATVLADGDKMPGAKWFPEARLNLAENLLRRGDRGDALVFWDETGFRRRVSYSELTSDNPIDLARYQVANCYMGRIGLINSGGASGDNDLRDAVRNNDADKKKVMQDFRDRRLEVLVSTVVIDPSASRITQRGSVQWSSPSVWPTSWTAVVTTRNRTSEGASRQRPSGSGRVPDVRRRSRSVEITHARPPRSPSPKTPQSSCGGFVVEMSTVVSPRIRVVSGASAKRAWKKSSSRSARYRRRGG